MENGTTASVTALSDGEGPWFSNKLSDVLEGICPAVRGRLLRILAAGHPTVAVPALLDVACQTENPAHAHMALVTPGRGSKRDREWHALIAESRFRLEKQGVLLRRLREETGHVVPPRPWDRPSGGIARVVFRRRSGHQSP